MSTKTISKFWKDPGFYLSLVFMTAVLLVICLSFGFSYRAKLFPLIVGFISLALISVDVLGKVFPALAAKIEMFRGGQVLDTPKLDSESSVDHSTMDEDSSLFDLRAFLKIVLWFSAYFILLNFVGYLLSIVIFLLFFLKFFCDCHWKTSVQITAGVALISWMVFTLVLDVPWLGGIEH